MKSFTGAHPDWPAIKAMAENLQRRAPEVDFPPGYCLDPKCNMCVPAEAGPHYDFGYEVGFSDAMSIKMRAIDAFLPIDGNTERVLRELDDTTNQTWRGKRARWAALVRKQAAEIAELDALKQQQAEITRLRSAIEEAMPFQMTLGAEILSKALGPNVKITGNTGATELGKTI